MTPRKTVLVFLWMVLLQSGCSAATPSIQDSSEDAVSPEGLFPHGMLLTIPGTVDEANRFLPAVRISTVIIDADHKKHYKPCSGVLVHPRLVITAGHCVCLERSPTAQEQVLPQAAAHPRRVKRSTALTRAEALEGVGRITSIIDSKSLCASTTTVTTIIYSSHDGHRGTQTLEYSGRIRVHDQLSLIKGVPKGKDVDPTLVWNNADLAAIFLKDTVSFPFEPVKLATSEEVKLESRIVMVGYGPGDSPHFFGDRQSGENIVTRLIPLETGSVLFRSELQRLPEGGPASYAEQGDSGGACVTQANPHVLVGIVTASAQRADGRSMSYFTSVFSHKEWLEAALLQADKS